MAEEEERRRAPGVRERKSTRAGRQAGRRGAAQIERGRRRREDRERGEEEERGGKDKQEGMVLLLGMRGRK